MLLNTEDFNNLLQLARDVKAEPRKFSKAKRLAVAVEEVLTRAKAQGLVK